MLKIYKHSYELHFKVAPDRFYGPVLRGGIGSHMRNALSVGEYDAVFNTQPDAYIMKRYTEVPKGYVVDVPFESARLINFDLVLFGSTKQYYSAFDYAIRKTANRNNAGCVYMGLSENNETSVSGIDGSEVNTNLLVSYLTPTDIRFKGRTWEKPEFHVIIRNIIRRFFLLSHYYGEGEVIYDKSLVSCAEGISIKSDKSKEVITGRYSTRKERHMDLSGKMGDVLYEGFMALDKDSRGKIYELLSFAEQAHIGKNTVFGCGKIAVQVK